MVVLNLVFIIYGTLSKIYNWGFSDFFLGFGTAVFIITWFVILSDIIRNKIFNKTFWIISMFIIPQVSTLFYLLQREKLIRLGDKFN